MQSYRINENQKQRFFINCTGNNKLLTINWAITRLDLSNVMIAKLW